MKSSIVLLFIIVLIFSSCNPPGNKLGLDNTSREEILKILKKQEEDWSKGDIEAYMEGYWKSDSLKFIGKNGVTYGWQNTMAKYQKSYPDKDSMGKLKFEIISMEMICFKTVLVIGKWNLTRRRDILRGYYSIIWKRIDGKWVIVTDHSS